MAADRDPHQIAGQRHREPHHVVRDVPGQREHPRADRLRQHLVHRHPEPGPHLAQPSLNVNHPGTVLHALNEERRSPACDPSGRRPHDRRPQRHEGT
jgi:hypothetical protein